MGPMEIHTFAATMHTNLSLGPKQVYIGRNQGTFPEHFKYKVGSLGQVFLARNITLINKY